MKTWTTLLIPVAHEQDPEFREVLLRHCKRGMLVVGILGILFVLVFISGNITGDRTFGFTYVDPNTVVLWDRLIIVVLSIITIILSRIPFSLRTGRLIVALIVFSIALISLLDDIQRGGLLLNLLETER